MSASSILDYTMSTVQQRELEKKNSAYGTSTTDFLQLLIAQLTNQDPLNPMEDMDFTSQLAQLQALEEQMAMTKSINAMRMDAQVQSATAMIGKEVTGLDRYGSEATGIVTRVIQTSDDIYVELANGQQVSVSSITNITGGSGDESLSSQLSKAANYIGSWIEAYDSDGNIVKGIVETAYISNGQVKLQLYGGKSVTVEQIGLMRAPTESESLYLLPDDIRGQMEDALGMLGLVITGKNDDGEFVTGMVANYGLGEDGKVYVVLFDGTTVDVTTITEGPSEPTAEDLARDLSGFWAIGLDEDGNAIEGLIIGAEDREDGTVLLLEGGGHIYMDALKEIKDAPESEDGGSGDDGDDTSADPDPTVDPED